MNKYLLVKGVAGLGNRIFVVITAILYARMTNRTMVVDWTDTAYTTRKENVFSQLFELKNMSFDEQPPESASVYPNVWENCLDQTMTEVIASESKLVKAMGQGIFRKYACDVRKLNYSEDIVIASGYDEEIEDLRPRFTSEYAHLRKATKGTIANEVFYKHLDLAPPVRDRLEAFKAVHMQGHKFIGIHIRQSDKSISYGWYKKALSEHVERHPDAHIFLATDNRDVEREIDGLYDNVVVLDKWLPAPGVAVHKNIECPDLEEHAVTALLDICLLAACDYLIFSRTTSFGRLASYISTQPVSQHFDIETYYDQQRKSIGSRAVVLRNKIDRNVKYGLAWLKLKGILPQRSL
ncbi:MAG: hypothetical protein AAF810_01820 [Cyanobacteria bacterium P01_D01_bin.36]